jgi:hypothetical protein
MSKKKIRDMDALDLLGTGEGTSFAEIDAELFGAIQQNDANRQTASPVSIFEIMPDPSQPRRAVPYRVREVAEWRGEPSRMGDLFDAWSELVQEERGGKPFDLVSILDQKEQSPDEERPDVIGPLEYALVSLVELATSIRNDGLTNPITVVRRGPQSYQLETGERRWLASHLLYQHTQDETFSKVAARVVDNMSLWRQAAENNARANLNAISKARQFSVLLMELLRLEDEFSFTPFHEFAFEQGYYAQVADGDQFRIPRGTSERLLHATGLKSQKQLREYRALLRLPKQVWIMADDLNWPERAIRELVSRALDEDDLVLLAAEKARSEGYTVPMGTVSRRQNKTTVDAVSHETEPPAPGTKQYYAHLIRALRKAKVGRGDSREQALSLIDEFRHWLNEEEQQIRRR